MSHDLENGIQLDQPMSTDVKELQQQLLDEQVANSIAIEKLSTASDVTTELDGYNDELEQYILDLKKGLRSALSYWETHTQKHGFIVENESVKMDRLYDLLNKR